LDGKIETDMFSYEKFVETIDKLTDYGFNSIELTPNVGDLFLDPEFTSKLTYLENNPKIKSYTFVSNFLAATPLDIYQIVLSQKCDCAVSIYGYDQESYLKTTGIDAFDKFFDVYTLISSKCEDYENAEPFTFYMRCSTFEDLPECRLKRGIRSMMKLGAKLENGETMNRNWGGMMNDNIGEKRGICSRVLAENGIYPNGDITACNCWDWKKELIIGNMNEQSLDEIYGEKSKFSEILANQFRNKYIGPCIKCDDFSPARDFHFHFPWTKIYKLFYK
jgi:radical SAM protein with 4Fe4S-binding SPASM domain